MVNVPVTAILQRVPERARTVYAALVAHPQTETDWITGWSYCYLSQERVAHLTGTSLRTVTRAVADLRAVGVVRVLTWPGATTETSVRLGDVRVPDSIFGPLRAMHDIDPALRVDSAISQLRQEFDEILWDIELSFFDYSEGGT